MVRRKAQAISEPEKIQGICPSCHGDVIAGQRYFKCVSCDFQLWRSISGRDLSDEEFTELIQKGELGQKQGFLSKKTGRQFLGSRAREVMNMVPVSF